MFPTVCLDGAGGGEAVGRPFFRGFHFPIGSADYELEPGGVVLVDEVTDFDLGVGEARSGTLELGARFFIANGFVLGVSIEDLEE